VGPYGDIPLDLPALWAALGERERAESMAGAMTDREDRMRATGMLGVAVGAAGDLDRAERLVRSVRVRAQAPAEPYYKARAWTDLAWLAAIAGDGVRAARLLRTAYAEARPVKLEYLQSELLLAWARVCAAGGDRGRAVEFTERAQALVKLSEPMGHRWVLDALPVIVTGTGELDRAETLVTTVPDPYDRARAAAELAVLAAARGDHGRAEAQLGAMTDEYRRDRLGDALTAIRGVEPHPGAVTYRQARALAGLAEVVAAGGGHAWGASAWAEPLVRYDTHGTHQGLIFATLAAGAAGGDRGRAAALADRAEAIVQPVADPDNQPPALVSLAWMVADAGDAARAAGLAGAAEALVRHTRRYRRHWRVADLAALALAPPAPHPADGLPTLAGTPKQEEWADRLRATLIAKRWPDGIPPRVAVALAGLTHAGWWIENRDRLDQRLTELAEASRMSELPPITGDPRRRKLATAIRTKLVRQRWGDEIPPGVRETLDRLTDAAWWVTSDKGDGHPMAIDRALGAELPEADRKLMALPFYGRTEPRHPGRCAEQPEYAPARRAAFEVASAFADLRNGKPGSMTGLGDTCCGQAGFRDGEKDGKQAWLARHASELRAASPRLTEAEAAAEARSDLARIERNLDGWG
jgi:hypothetical protein